MDLIRIRDVDSKTPYTALFWASTTRFLDIMASKFYLWCGSGSAFWLYANPATSSQCRIGSGFQNYAVPDPNKFFLSQKTFGNIVWKGCSNPKYIPSMIHTRDEILDATYKHVSKLLVNFLYTVQYKFIKLTQSTPKKYLESRVTRQRFQKRCISKTLFAQGNRLQYHTISLY